MPQYVDKSALISEIKKKIHIEQGYSSGDAECGYRDCARDILSFINTLETKKVDLEKEIKRFTMSKELYEADSVIKAVAEHFFELGLKAQKGE